MPTPMPGRTAAAARGFTLLELMVTIGVISVLMGISLGFLSRSTGRPEAMSALAGELRAASLSARATGLPTEVVVAPDPEGLLTMVRARSLQPVVVFHCEPDQQFLNPDLRPTLLGLDVREGRFGHGRRPNGDQPEMLLRWPAPVKVADFRDGFALRLDLLLEQRTGCALLRLGKALEVDLEPDGRVRARLQLRSGTGNTGQGVPLQAQEPLPLHRWCTVEIAADGRSFWLEVDGRELARAAAPGSVLQHIDQDALEVSLRGEPLPGVLDELRVFVYRFGEPQRLPVDVQVAQAVRIGFDAHGEPIGKPTIELELVQEGRNEVLRVLRGGVLQ